MPCPISTGSGCAESPLDGNYYLLKVLALLAVVLCFSIVGGQALPHERGKGVVHKGLPVFANGEEVGWRCSCGIEIEGDIDPPAGCVLGALFPDDASVVEAMDELVGMNKCAFCDSPAQHWVSAEIGAPIHYVCEQCVSESARWG